MENTMARHPMVRILQRFHNGQRTDVEKKTITNSDFIALCLYAFGPFGLKELRQLCGLWRGPRLAFGASAQPQLDDRVLDSYFTPHYGYTATDATGRVAYTGLAGRKNRKRRYWYRQVEHQARMSFPECVQHPPHGCVQPMRRYRNALTLAGIARAEELVLALSGHKAL